MNALTYPAGRLWSTWVACGRSVRPWPQSQHRPSVGPRVFGYSVSYGRQQNTARGISVRRSANNRGRDLLRSFARFSRGPR